MLTGTMNAEDLQRVYECDKERIFRFLNHKENELRRQLKKGFSKKCAKCYDFRTPNADYKLSLCVYVRRSIFDVYMYIKETNEYVVVTAKAHQESSSCLVFTPHYIRRLSERMYGVELTDVSKTLTRFIMDCNTSIYLYNRDMQFVFALHNGISLAQYDKKRDLMLMKTFVSTSMLKDTQIAAWGRVADYVVKFDKLVEENGARHGYTYQDIIDQLSYELMTIDFDEITKIYGDYFKKKEK